MKFLILFLLSTSALATEVLTINRGGLRTNPTNAQQVQFEVRFSDQVQNVQVSDFRVRSLGQLVGAQIVDVRSYDNQTFTVDVRYFTGQGTLGLNLFDTDGSILDLENKPLTQSTHLGVQYFTIDNVGPRLQYLYSAGSFPAGNQVIERFIARFDEPVFNVYSGSFYAFGAGVYIRSVSGTGNTRTIEVVKRDRYQIVNLRLNDPGHMITDRMGNRRRF